MDLAAAIAAELGEDAGSKADSQEQAAGDGALGSALGAAISAELAGEPSQPPSRRRAEREGPNTVPPVAASEDAGEQSLRPDDEPAEDPAHGKAESNQQGRRQAANTRISGRAFASFAKQGGGGEAAAAAAETAAKAAELQFSPGDEVEIFGLMNAASQQFNEMVGVVHKYIELKGRYVIRFGAGEYDVNIRPENLRRPGEGRLEDQEHVKEVDVKDKQPEAATNEKAPQAQATAGVSEHLSEPKGSQNEQVVDLPVNEAGSAQENLTGAAQSSPSEQTPPPVSEADATKVNSRSAAPVQNSSANLQQPQPPAVEEDPAQVEPSSSYSPGDRVAVHGLASDIGQKLNGQEGTIGSFLEEKGRFEVTFASGETINLKPANIIRLEEARSAEPDKPPTKDNEESEAKELHVAGDAVEIFGLTSETGKKLNGQRGMVGKYIEDTGRVEVSLPSGDTINVKASNLRKVEKTDGAAAEADPRRPSSQEASLSLNSGDIVEVFGLESAAGQRLNGSRGIISVYDEERSRFEVRFSFRGPAHLKSESLRKLELTTSVPASPKQETNTISLGDVVQVSGLESENGQKLNGQKGIICKLDDEKGRFEVCLALGNPTSLRPANLTKLFLPVDTEGDAAPPVADSNLPASGEAAEAPDLQDIFDAGDVVEVSGLESASGQQVNGHIGVVKEFNKDKGRFDVSFSALSKLLTLKPQNLRKLELDVGACVEVLGLTSESGRQLNGQKGIIARFVEEKERFEVRLVPEKLVSFRSDNLLKLTSEEVLESVQEQLLQEVRKEYIQGLIDELRSSCKNMRQYGMRLENILRPIRGPVYERHGVDREWHLRIVEEVLAIDGGDGRTRTLHEELQDLCAFAKEGSVDAVTESPAPPDQATEPEVAGASDAV